MDITVTLQMATKDILDLPNEVIEKYVLARLSSKDVYSFGSTGNKRFKLIADNVLQKRGKIYHLR